MFVRDSLTSMLSLQQNTQQWLGDSMDDGAAADPGNDPLLTQLHQLALLIVSLRQQADNLMNQVSDASNDTVDVNQLTAIMQQIAQYTAQFAQVAAQRTAQNPYALGWTDQAVLDVGNWAQGFLTALPNAVAALPNALVDAISQIVANAGKAAGNAISPWVIGAVALGAVVLFGARKAETTRTYRKYVA